jgi:hypothetical protein
MLKALRTVLDSWKPHRVRAAACDAFGPANESPEPRRVEPTVPAAPANASTDPGSQEERIRVQAYLLAQDAGFPDGRAEEFWRLAEEEIKGLRGPLP